MFPIINRREVPDDPQRMAIEDLWRFFKPQEEHAMNRYWDTSFVFTRKSDSDRALPGRIMSHSLPWLCVSIRQQG